MAHDDERLSALAEDLGAEAYGVYWLILEAIAAPMEPTSRSPVATHSDVKWASICHVSVRKFRTIAIRMRELKLIETISVENRLKIHVPNLLKYRDEYSNKSRHAPDSRADTDNRADTEREQREKRPPIPSETIEQREKGLADADWAEKVYLFHPKQVNHDGSIERLVALKNNAVELALFEATYPGWIDYWSGDDPQFAPPLVARDGKTGFLVDLAYRKQAPLRSGKNGRKSSQEALAEFRERMEREINEQQKIG